MQRHLECDVVPMARQFGIGMCPWSVLSGGKFQTRKQVEARKKADEGMRGMFGGNQSEYLRRVSEALEHVAKENSKTSTGGGLCPKLSWTGGWGLGH